MALDMQNKKMFPSRIPLLLLLFLHNHTVLLAYIGLIKLQLNFEIWHAETEFKLNK